MSEFAFDCPITMLGARGVGKTSMIAAMVNEFDSLFDGSVQLHIPDEQTNLNLEKLLKELKRVAAGKPGFVDTGAIGVKPNDDYEKHGLELVHVLSGGKMTVTFHDYPGNWLHERQGVVVDALARASIILVAVDTPALMELGDDDHEEVNRPFLINRILGPTLLRERERKRLVVFVPVRCERWVQEDRHGELWGKFSERYGKVLKTLSPYKAVAAAVCPIQTLGSVHFAYYEGLKPWFTRVADHYSPRDCDQPLRYCLAFMLNQMYGEAGLRKAEAEIRHRERSRLRKTLTGFMNLFGVESSEQEALRVWAENADGLLGTLAAYAEGCETNPPFGFIQNQELIGV